MTAIKPTRIPAWLEPHVSLCEAVAALFPPLVEVAVHDLRRARVVAAWGTARVAAVPASLVALAGMPDSPAVVGPVAVTLPGGRAGTAVGVVLRNAKGAPRGVLAVSFDRSPLDDVVTALQAFAAPPQAAALLPSDGQAWRDEIAGVVDAECRGQGMRRDRLTKEQRLALVGTLDARGLFSTRNAAAHAAQALGVSRTTVYDLLKEARRPQVVRA